MSKVGGQVKILKNSKPDQIPNRVNELITSLFSSPELSEEEIADLYNVGISFMQNQLPGTSRAGFSLLNKVLDIIPNKKFRKNLTHSLKIPLSSSKKQIRELAIELSQKVMTTFNSANSFWKFYGQFTSPSKQQQVVLRESLLTLFLYTLDNYPDFKCFNYADSIAKSLPDSNPEVRKLAMDCFTSLYAKDKSKATKALKEGLPRKYEEYLTKLSGETVTKAVETYADIANEEQLTNEEIEEQTAEEFKNPFPEISPNKKEFPASDLEKKMGRQVDWEERVDAIKQCVAHARGARDKKKYASDFKLLSSGFIECLCDARSALSKISCIALAAIAKSIGSAFDQNSVSLIPPLFGRLGHATRIIALSAELAITTYVENVWGKGISMTLTNCRTAASNATRLVAAKCIVIALEKWPAHFTKDFPEMLNKMGSDKAEEVRSYVASIDIDKIGEKHTMNQEPTEKEKPKKEENIFTPISVKSGFVNETPLPQIKQSTEQEKKDEAFKNLISDGTPEEIMCFLEENDFDITNHVDEILEEITMEMNEESCFEPSKKMMKLVFSKYSKVLTSRIGDILHELPPDDSYGMFYVNFLADVYGPVRLVPGLAASPFLYAQKFNISTAYKHNDDANLCSVIVKGAITNKFTVPLKDDLINIIKVIYAKDKAAAEAIIGIIDANQREEFLNLVGEGLPQLKKDFAHESNNEIRNHLKEMVGASTIDINALEEALNTNDSNKLLVISIIRQAPNYDPRFAGILIKCIKTDDQAVSGAAVNAFRVQCEGKEGAIMEIANSIDTSRVILTLFHRALLKAGDDEAEKAMTIAKEAVDRALEIPNSRFAALSVIASCCIKFKSTPQELAGDLSVINQKMIQTIVNQINKNM